MIEVLEVMEVSGIPVAATPGVMLGRKTVTPAGRVGPPPVRRLMVLALRAAVLVPGA